MKRGCFFGFSFIIIAIGIAFYIGEKYGSQLYDIGEQKVNQFYNEQVQAELNHLNGLSGAYSDSVKLFLSKKLEELKNKELKLTKSQIKKLKEEGKLLSKKSKIDSIDFKKLEKIFQ